MAEFDVPRHVFGDPEKIHVDGPIGRLRELRDRCTIDP